MVRRVSVVISLQDLAARSQAWRAFPAASADSRSPALSGASPCQVARAARDRSRISQWWLMTMTDPADWRSESAVRPGDQDACGARSQLTWRIRSALPTVPSHKAGTVSVPSGTRRAGTALTGIACSRRASSAGTGSRRSAAWTRESSTVSHWQAEVSSRRACAVPRCTRPGNSASTAPCDAICRAYDPACNSSARVTGTELTAGVVLGVFGSAAHPVNLRLCLAGVLADPVDLLGYLVVHG